MTNKLIAMIGFIMLALGGLAWVVFGLGGQDQSSTPGKAEVSDVSKTESTGKPGTQTGPDGSGVPANTGSETNANTPVNPNVAMPNASGKVDEDITNLQKELEVLDKNTLKDGDLEGLDAGLGSSY